MFFRAGYFVFNFSIIMFFLLPPAPLSIVFHSSKKRYTKNASEIYYLKFRYRSERGIQLSLVTEFHLQIIV